MSLLNDALRKKNIEQGESEQLPASIRIGTTYGKNRRIRWFAVAMAMIALAVGLFLVNILNQDSTNLAASDYPRIAVSPEVETSVPAPPQTANITEPTVSDIETRVAAAPLVNKIPEPEITAADGAKTIIAMVEGAPSVDSTAKKTIKSEPTGPKKPAKAPQPKKKVDTVAPPASPTAEKPLPAEVKSKATVSRTTTAEALYEKARQYHRRRMFSQAITMYEQAVAVDPNHYNARFNLTSAYLDNEQYDYALASAADLHRQRPDDSRVTMNLAVAHLGCGRPRVALELMDRIIDQPKAPLYEIYFHKGIAFRKLQEPENAVKWYKRALKIHEDDPKLLFNMALAQDQLRQYASAVKYYQDYLDHAVNLDGTRREQIHNRVHILQIEAQEQKKASGVQ